MFKQLKPLNREEHRSLRFSAKQPYHFAADMMVSPIVAGEAAMIAREYPIVFARAADDVPLALLGVKEGVNAYVRPSGHWMARYIPAHVRRFPFMLANSTSPDKLNGKRAFTIMIDTAAPHFSSEQGEALFTPTGEPTAVLLKVQEVLTNLQHDTERTRKLVHALDAAGLLIERVLQAKPKNGGKPLALKGMRVIDTTKLATCAPDTLQALNRSGALMLIYAHLISLANLQDGPLLQNRTESTAAQIGDTISFGGIDWSKQN